MPIIHQSSDNQFVYMTEQGIQAGLLAYRFVSPNKIDAFHTNVDSAFQGKGIAGELYNALIVFAQQQDLKIKPSCSYIDAKMSRSHPELIG